MNQPVGVRTTPTSPYAVYVTFAATGCARWRVTRLEVRIHTPGRERNQGVPFGPALNLGC